MPFLDGMTAGYILKLPQDFAINLNKTDEENKCLIHEVRPSLNNNILPNVNLNYGHPNDWHSVLQVKNSPFLNKNGNISIFKILNPWIIKTPIGYSSLFISPIGSSEDRFYIIPAIVDTDSFNLEVNFPIVFNTEKYNNQYKSILKKGTPYVQVIPFKREEWKMELKSFNNQHREKNLFNFLSNFALFYKLKVRKKKTWK
jgi:hypothetical protein